MKDCLDDYVSQEEGSLHACVRSWQSADDIRARLRQGIELEVVRTRDLERARSFRDYIAREDTSDTDFLQREVQLGNDRRAVLGLRFKGGRDGPPFVTLCARNFPITHAADLRLLLDAARDCYGKFSPAWLNVGQGAQEDWLQATGLPCRADQLWFAGRVSDLQSRALPQRIDELDLEPLKDTSFHAGYLETMARLHAESEFHRREVSVQPEDQFADSITQGLCFRAIVNGESAGIIAALQRDCFGMHGTLALELLLTAPFRGKGLASAMQRKLIERMDPSANQIFYGEIDPGNAASLGTARSCGRVHVGGRWWVDL